MTSVTDLTKDLQVASVDSLAAGDIYKRLEKSYSNEYSFHYGKVLDVVNNGDEVAITAVEFTAKYGSASRKIKVFGAENKLELFPVTAQEFGVHLEEAVEAAGEAVKAANEALVRAKNVSNELHLLAGEFKRALADIEEHERSVDLETPSRPI